MGRSRGSKKRAKDVGNNVNAEVTMAAAIRKVREVLSEQSEQEIREMLLQCGVNHYEAIDRLVSQQDLRDQQGTSTQLPDPSTTLVPNQSAITNGVIRGVPISSSEEVPNLHVPSSSDVTNGETKTVVAISSSEAAPTLSVPSSGDVTNGETRSVPISSSEAVPPLSMPSSRAITNAKPKIQDTRMISAYGPSMAEVVRGLHASKAPVKADDSPSLHQKPDAISNSFTQCRDPQHSAFPMDHTTQSIATASPLGPRPPTFMAEAFGNYPSSGSEPHINQEAMNRGQVPSGQYGSNMIPSPYLRHPAQNRPPPAPIQRRGGGSSSHTLSPPGKYCNMMNSPHSWLEENDAAIYQSMDSVFAQYRNNTLPLSSTSTVPSSHASDYAFDAANSSSFGYHLPSNSSGVPSSHGSDYVFDMSSGKAANSSRLGYEDVSRIHLPTNSSSTSSTGPSSHGFAFGFDAANSSRLGYEDVSRIQGRNPFVWRELGEDSYTSIPPLNRQEREAYFERIRAHLDQEEFNISDPSDQTQQRPRDK